MPSSVQVGGHLLAQLGQRARELLHRARTSRGRGARASGRGSDTACARGVRCPWPGCAPSDTGRSRRPPRPAGCQARGCAPARSVSVTRRPSLVEVLKALPRRAGGCQAQSSRLVAGAPRASGAPPRAPGNPRATSAELGGQAALQRRLVRRAAITCERISRSRPRSDRPPGRRPRRRPRAPGIARRRHRPSASARPAIASSCPAATRQRPSGDLSEEHATRRASAAQCSARGGDARRGRALEADQLQASWRGAAQRDGSSR